MKAARIRWIRAAFRCGYLAAAIGLPTIWPAEFTLA
jgi:hypothetical protein